MTAAPPVQQLTTHRKQTTVASALVGALLLFAQPAFAQSQNYSIIPRPAVVDARRGQFNLKNTTTLRAPAAFHGVAHRFARDIANATNFDLAVKSTGAETGTHAQIGTSVSMKF